MTETTRSFRPSSLPEATDLAFSSRRTEPTMDCGDMHEERRGRSSGKDCSANLTQAGQQEVKRGSLAPGSPAARRPRNSVASSTTVRSAPKAVSYTASKPSMRRAAAMRPVVMVPAERPKRSPRATRTAGATWATTLAPGSSISFQTASTCERGTMAAVGQMAAHWPQFTQSTSPRDLPKAGVTQASVPRWAKSMAPMPWISAQ